MFFWKRRNIIIILALILIGSFLIYYFKEENSGLFRVTQEGGFRPFSYLDQDISDGNIVSHSGVVNPLVYQDKWKDTCNKPTDVYLGSSTPLLHQMRPMAIPKNTMFYFANAEFSPECCVGGAPYSTSSGCVCAFPKQIYRCPSEKPYEFAINGPNSWQLDPN